MSESRAGGSRLCPLVRSELRSQLLCFVAAESFQIFRTYLSKNVFDMLVSRKEKMYQRLADIVAERLRRSEAQQQQQEGQQASQKIAEKLPSFESSTSSQSGSSLSRSPSVSSDSALLSRESSVASSFSTPPSQKSRSSLSRSSSGSSLSRSSSDPVLSHESQILSEEDSQILSEEDSQIFNEQDSQMSDLGGDISNESEDENSIRRDGYDGIKLRRGAKASYSAEDRIAVTPAVLSEIDWCYLAPRHSLLYPDATANGSSLKRATMDFNKFKELIKPTIRDLAGRCVSRVENIHQRFFWAAYDVVRKRRANHVQNWRLHNAPRDLIYGGRRRFINVYGDPWKCMGKKRMRRRRRKRKSSKNLTFEEPAAKEPKTSHDQASSNN